MVTMHKDVKKSDATIGWQHLDSEGNLHPVCKRLNLKLID
jgi:hypothetical protein